VLWREERNVNFLFYMYLSGEAPQTLVGNFMGDFVKGPLRGDYPAAVRQGLLLHRKIDSFAQHNSDFQASRLRLSPDYGLYRGVLVDLFYDHFLAQEWGSWSGIPFAEYLLQARTIIDRHLSLMPQQLQEFVPIIFGELLPSYQNIAGISSALKRMSRRIKRPNPLGEGGAELELHYEEIRADFERFIPAARCFAADFIAFPDGKRGA